MTNYAAVLGKNYPGTIWILNGDDYSGLEWLDSTPKPTQAQLDAAWPQVAGPVYFSHRPFSDRD